MPISVWGHNEVNFEVIYDCYQVHSKCSSYPEIDNANWKSTLWTFKQWLAFKMWVHYGISIVLYYHPHIRHFRDICFKVILMTFTCDLRINMIMFEPHHFKLIFYKPHPLPNLLTLDIIDYLSNFILDIFWNITHLNYLSPSQDYFFRWFTKFPPFRYLYMF